MIEERQITKTVRRIVSPARSEDQATGEFILVDKIDAEGNQIQEQKPIMTRVLVPPQHIDEEVNETIYVVNDGVDEHLFKTREQAERFEGGV